MNTTMSLVDLGDDILLNVLIFLAITDISNLRQVCRYFHTLTSTRYLWKHLLERDVIGLLAPLPYYRKPTIELPASGIESLVRRALAIDELPNELHVTRFDQRGSVTWVRLIHGQWILVALGDYLELYSIASVQAGHTEPAARTRLPGKAHSGEIDVQADQLVISLSVGAPEGRKVILLSIRQHAGGLEFHELCQFNGISHVRSLKGDLVGCGMLGESQHPSLLNWRTGQVNALPLAASDTDCLAMSMREDYCVTVRSSGMQVHTYSKSGVQLAETFQFDDAVSGVSISKEREILPACIASNDFSDRLLIITTCNTATTLYQLQRQGATSFTMSKITTEQFKANDARKTRPAQPCFGGSMSRISWVNSSSNFMACRPSLATVRVQDTGSESRTDPKSFSAELDVIADMTHHRIPSLLTLPVRDYDDGAGLLVMGNATGHLALCSDIGRLSSGLLQCFQEVPFPVRAV